ncbi:MAG: RNA polymerase sigma factor [Acutalibacteraceae bacterium]
MQKSLLRTDKELTEIYHRHVNTVYRVCLMYMKNRFETEDMVQNTFIKLMRDSTKFENEEHEKAWLIRTAINLCKDHYRHSWTKSVPLDEIKERESGEHFEISDTLEKIMALPPKYKTAIYMYYYEGYSTVEIAKILRKNESTVRSFLHTGRKLLKIEMEDELA